MFNAMLRGARSGAPWRDLPDSRSNWKSVYTRCRRWQKAGIWDEGLEHVSLDSDEESVMIDATIVRIHQQDLAQKRQSKRSDVPVTDQIPKFLMVFSICVSNIHKEFTILV